MAIFLCRAYKLEILIGKETLNQKHIILHHWFDEWKGNYSKLNEIDFIDDVWGRLYCWMGVPTASTLYWRSPLVCPQWLVVWAEGLTANFVKAAFAHTMQGDCRGRAPLWNLQRDALVKFMVQHMFFDASVWRVRIWDHLKRQIICPCTNV